MTKRLAKTLNQELSNLSFEKRITYISQDFSSPIFTTSLGLEDQVITWGIANFARKIHVSTLQTGRLFPQVLSLISITRDRYGIEIEEVEPEVSAIDDYVREFGANGFYDSIEARKKCCEVRKLNPLKDILKNADAWITGLRRGQSDNRKDIPFAQWDDEFKLFKFNPLADWTYDQIKEAVIEHEIPVNPMHERGYPSIGCEPCTRAIKPGESDRAGRWWWEQDMSRECGLHPVRK